MSWESQIPRWIGCFEGGLGALVVWLGFAALAVLPGQEVRREGTGPVVLGDRVAFEVRVPRPDLDLQALRLLPPDAGPLRFDLEAPRAVAGYGFAFRASAIAEVLGPTQFPGMRIDADAEVLTIPPGPSFEVERPKSSTAGWSLAWELERNQEGSAEVDLVLRWPKGFREQRLVSLFARPLELPISIGHPDLSALFSGQVLPPRAASGPELVVQGSVRRVDLLPAEDAGDGHEGVRIRIARIESASQTALDLPVAWVDFAWATHFEESFSLGRVPVDRRQDRVLAEAVRLELGASMSRAPRGYAGPVGRFDLEVQLGLVVPGQSVELIVRLLGAGELRGQALPDWPSSVAALRSKEALPAAAGSLVGERRTLDWPSAGQLPALEWPYFDALTSEFKIARSEPIALTLAEPSYDFLVIGLLAAFVLTALSFVLVRRRAHLGARAPSALEVALAAQADPTADQLAILQRFLAERTGRSSDAIDARGLARDLERQGVFRPLAEETEVRLLELLAARFGQVAPPARDDASLLRRLDLALPARPDGGKTSG